MTSELPNDFANEVLAATPNGYNPWFLVTEKQPEGAPIVLMYCESNNSFVVGHFSLYLSARGIPVTHWQPLISPKEYERLIVEIDMDFDPPLEGEHITFDNRLISILMSKHREQNE